MRGTPPASKETHPEPRSEFRRPEQRRSTPIGPRELRRRVLDLRRSIGRQVREARLEAGIDQATLARSAGVDRAHLWRIEAGTVGASLDVLVALGGRLGSEVGVRLFPTIGPRLRDRFQAPMVEALLRELDGRWHAVPEVPVPTARGSIDLVLDDADAGIVVACEAHSELRRLEEVLRRAQEKSRALQGQHPGCTISRLLLLRSTVATRQIARLYEATLVSSFPGRTSDAVAALRTRAPWPGDALVWVDLTGERAWLRERPPRSVRVGR